MAPTQSVVISHYFFFALSRSSAAVQPETIGMSGRDAAGAQLSAVRKHINISVCFSLKGAALEYQQTHFVVPT